LPNNVQAFYARQFSDLICPGFTGCLSGYISEKIPSEGSTSVWQVCMQAELSEARRAKLVDLIRLTGDKEKLLNHSFWPQRTPEMIPLSRFF